MAEETTSAKRPRRSRLAVRLGAASLSVLLALLGGEVAVRVFRPESDFFSRSDETTGVAGIPDRTGWSRSSEFATHVATNSFGFRDRERSVAKAPGAKRVIVLGDSFTEALQVELAETFHARLEERLRAKLGPSLDVVAMGLPGVGTAQELLLYESEGYRFQPDVVLVAWFSGNDLSDNNPASKTYFPGFLPGPGPDDLVPAPWTKQPGSDGFFSELVRSNRSHLLSLVARTYRRFWLDHESKQHAPVVAPVKAPGGETAAPSSATTSATTSASGAPPLLTDEASWEITRRIVKRLRDDASSHGASVVIAMIPSEKQLPAHEYGERLGAICRALGVVSLDLAPALRKARAAHPDELLYFPKDGHFTRSGHAAIVPALEETLAPLLAR